MPIDEKYMRCGATIKHDSYGSVNMHVCFFCTVSILREWKRAHSTPSVESLYNDIVGGLRDEEILHIVELKGVVRAVICPKWASTYGKDPVMIRGWGEAHDLCTALMKLKEMKEK